MLTRSKAEELRRNPPKLINSSSLHPLRIVFKTIWIQVKAYVKKETLLNANSIILFTNDPYIDFEYTQKNIKDQVIFSLALDGTFVSKDRLCIYSRFLQHAVEYPNYFEHTKDKLICKIKTHCHQSSRESNEDRKNQLKSLMVDAGFPRGNPLNFTRFISNEEYLCPEELVSILILQVSLSRYCDCVWGAKYELYRQKVKDRIFNSDEPSKDRWIPLCKEFLSSPDIVNECLLLNHSDIDIVF